MWILENLWLSLCLFIIVVVLSSLLPRLWLNIKYRDLPPGPFCWPILGYLPFFNKDNNYQMLAQLARKYGGVFSLYVGSRFAVVIDDFDALKNAYSREEFLGRPVDMFNISTDPKQQNVGGANGPLWKEHRTFFHSFLRYMTSGSQDVVKTTTVDLIRDVVDELKRTEGQEVRVDHKLELFINNVTFYICFGKTFDKEHEVIRGLGEYDQSLLTFFDLNALKVFFPWLGVLASFVPKFSRATKKLEWMDRMVRREIKEHKQKLDENDPRDFVDMFLLQMQKAGATEYYDEEKILGDVKILLLTASESSKTTLVWFLILMAEYPEVQEKIQVELDSVLGRDREPLLTDRIRLPLLDSAMMETLRYRNVVHINVPRMVLKDTTLCGYTIPKDTIIFHNLTSCLRNPKYWSHPDRFMAERFLNEDRTSVQLPDQFIPFSYGKRNCLGEKIAASTLFLFSARLLQKFKVFPPEGGVSMEIKVNFTNGHRCPLLRFQSRG